jgi:lipopolysaccharide transport protein LptA
MSMHSVWLILVPFSFGWLFAAVAADLAVQDLKFSADITDSNLREDFHVMRGNVRISQEAMSIEADQATASALQSKSSRWTFERSVHIHTQDADLKSNSASAAFNDGALSTARVQGTPALFEQRRTAGKTVRGRAGVIEYDLATGILKLTGEVWFSYGDNEIRTDTVVYNLREERVVGNPTGEQRGGVNITIRPQRRSSGAGNSDAPRPNSDESGE